MITKSNAATDPSLSEFLEPRRKIWTDNLATSKVCNSMLAMSAIRNLLPLSHFHGFEEKVKSNLDYFKSMIAETGDTAVIDIVPSADFVNARGTSAIAFDTHLERTGWIRIFISALTILGMAYFVYFIATFQADLKTKLITLCVYSLVVIPAAFGVARYETKQFRNEKARKREGRPKLFQGIFYTHANSTAVLSVRGIYYSQRIEYFQPKFIPWSDLWDARGGNEDGLIELLDHHGRVVHTLTNPATDTADADELCQLIRQRIKIGQMGNG